jgi:8-oxo-dGTP diphosphatase
LQAGPAVSSTVDVAVAVLVRGDGAVLLAMRPQGKVFAGYWEFPGGKVEPGEAVESALARELMEELGIVVERAYPWIVREFVYPHATVRLHFFRIVAWQGTPQPVEHQAMSWKHPDKVDLAPLLPANGPVLKSLQLPEEYAITDAASLGIDVFFARLERRLANGLRLVQVREKSFSREALKQFTSDVVAMSRQTGARVIVNADVELARLTGADGVHLTSDQLAHAASRPELPWCGASCHSVSDLRKAEALGVDFVVLGPVQPTASHPEAQPIGWPAFGSMVAGAAIPVYALGGLTRADLDMALQSGGHGIAMQRGSWTE